MPGADPCSRRSACLFAISALALPPIVAATAELLEDRDYTAVAGAPETAGAVEVIEFFSLGCRGCYAFEPYISRWSERLPPNTVFTRLPISLGYPKWAPLSRAYYALEATGELTRLRQPLFEAIHQQRRTLVDANSLAAWVGEQNGRSAEFRTAFDSQAVAKKVQNAEALARAFRVDRTPRLVIDHRYAVIGKAAKGFDDWLAIADALIDRALHDRATR